MSRAGSEKLLVDTNLFVLFIVGAVNIRRIETFKRTRKYDRRDYELLVRVMEQFKMTYTVAHVMAEVSNLTDLTGPELAIARRVLKEAIAFYKNHRCPVPAPLNVAAMNGSGWLTPQLLRLPASTTAQSSLTTSICIAPFGRTLYPF